MKEYPEQPMFHVTHSIAYSQTSNSAKAFEILNEAEKKFPDHYEILFQKAKIYEDMHEFDKAIE